MVAAANLVEVAALVGDTARATMLNALMGGQIFERSLRSLYRSSDGVRGRGAAVKYLDHSPYRNEGSV